MHMRNIIYTALLWRSFSFWKRKGNKLDCTHTRHGSKDTVSESRFIFILKWPALESRRRSVGNIGGHWQLTSVLISSERTGRPREELEKDEEEEEEEKTCIETVGVGVGYRLFFFSVSLSFLVSRSLALEEVKKRGEKEEREREKEKKYL